MTPRRFKCSQFRKGTLDFNFECFKLLQNDFRKQGYTRVNATIPGQDRFTQKPICAELFLLSLLAHLSRRLIGELIGYPWSGIRPSVVRPFTMLKDLLLRKRWADQSQILCGASLGRGNDILFTASGSHDQDGRHAHIW